MKQKNFVTEMNTLIATHTHLSQSRAQDLNKLHDMAPAAYLEFVLQEGFVDKPSLLKCLSLYYQLPHFDVVGYFFDHALLHNFPKDVLLRHSFIPVDVDQDMLLVVIADPTNEESRGVIRSYVPYEIEYAIGLARDIQDAVKEFYDTSLTDTEHDETAREDEIDNFIDTDLD